MPMAAHPPVPNAGTRPVRHLRDLRRRVAVSGAVLAVGLLPGACDDQPSSATTAPRALRSANVASAPGTSSAPSASVADPFEHVGPQQGDEAGVAAVVAAWDAAWNRGDAAGLAATFVDDAEFINAGGQLQLGAAEIRARHVVSLAGQFRGSHTEGRIRRITFLSGTAAVLDVDNALTRYEPVAPGSTTLRAVQQSGRHKRLVVKRGGVWRVLLFQNTMLAAASIP